jgi:hypothetical protein
MMEASVIEETQQLRRELTHLLLVAERQFQKLLNKIA